MPKCCFKDCRNVTSRTLKKDGISYFRFPRDPIRCGKWLAVVASQRGEENYKLNRSSVVCSQHFAEKDMYTTDKGIKRLHKSACPRKYVSIRKPNTVKEEKKEISKDGCENDVNNSKHNLEKEENPNPIPMIVIVNDYTQLGSADEGSVKSTESTTDTPHLNLLKKELSKLREKSLAKDREMEKIKARNAKMYRRVDCLKKALFMLKRKIVLKPIKKLKK